MAGNTVLDGNSQYSRRCTEQSGGGSLAAFLYLPGRIISMVTLCAYGYILLKLSSESSRYRMAAICCLASVAVDAGSSLVPEGAAMASLIGLLSFPVMILAFYGEYSEYMGHSEVICALDEEMAVKWKRLWKWFVYSLD